MACGFMGIRIDNGVELMGFKYDQKEEDGVVYVIPYLKRGTRFYKSGNSYYNAKQIFVKSQELLDKIIDAMKDDFWKVSHEDSDSISFQQADHYLEINKRFGA